MDNDKRQRGDMSGKQHNYCVLVEWTGNLGTGTSGYKDFSRSHEISVPGTGRPSIPGSSDPAFRGDASRWNPEDLLVASVATCHKLWYLHLCATGGVIVIAYRDEAVGTMEEGADGAGRFTGITLHPLVTIAAGSDMEKARSLHEKAHGLCFIANSVNFPVRCEPEIRIEA
jgi:organic hydroperoxide reductase OsmC/OhrA